MTAAMDIQPLLKLVRNLYPDWNGFEHPKFVEEEIEYKRRVIQKTASTLSREELERLRTEGRTGEIASRVRGVGTNLLYLGNPSNGDLALLYDKSFDPASFVEALLDLLHGPDDSPRRLDRFVAWARQRQLRVRWALPTYLLFLAHPDRDYFVKPGVVLWFLESLGNRALYKAEPTGEIYAQILDAVNQLKRALSKFAPRDMVEVQSFLFVAHSVATSVYTLEECAESTGLEIGLLDRWVSAIHRKKQAILYGPPGTGKTHLAHQLARHLTGGSRGFFELVQFHPSYSYEEFMEGIRPEARPDGGLDYPLKKGRFLEFCDRASELEEEDICVLILDEINRANLSRVFGELMYLLEYRNEEIPLASGSRFSIPSNVRILGTMNTADRSIALVDHALRRRFAFLSLRPDFGILRRFHDGNGFPVERLIALLQRLNDDIRDPHYEVGISFFLRKDLANDIEDIWRMEIVPYLEEYFFDQPEKVKKYQWEQVRKDLQG